MMLDLDPKIAEQAKAADNAALSAFHTKVIELSDKFSIKEAARLLRVSTGYLRTYSGQRGITYADRDNRTPEQKRQLKKLWDHYLIHYELRQVEAPAAPVQPGELEINPGLELKSRQAWVKGQNGFLARCIELAELFTVAEAADILGVTHRFLKTYAYNEQLTFVGGPSLDVKNEFFERAEQLAGVNTPIQEAAKELNVTTRYLTGYAKHWSLSFALTEVAASLDEEDDAEGDHSFIADMCFDEVIEDVAATATSTSTSTVEVLAPAAVAAKPEHVEDKPELDLQSADLPAVQVPTIQSHVPFLARAPMRSRPPVRSRSPVTLVRIENKNQMFPPSAFPPQAVPRYGTQYALF